MNEHMRCENAYDFHGAIGAFHRPRYEVVTDGELWDGADGVHSFLSQNHEAFPDFHFEPTRVSGCCVYSAHSKRSRPMNRNTKSNTQMEGTLRSAAGHSPSIGNCVNSSR